MYKNRMRIICLVLSLILSIVVVGCSTQQSTGSTTKESTVNDATAASDSTKGSKTESPVVIKMMLNDHVQSPMSMDIQTFKTLGEKCNITIEFEIVPASEYNEKANLVLASKQYPDVMRSGQSFYKYHDQGIFHQLNDLVESKVPNFIKACNDAYLDMLKNLKDDQGRLWYFTKIEYSPYERSPYINADWLAELNLEPPRTINELEKVLYAFKEAKPNEIVWVKGPWLALPTMVYNYFGSHTSWIHAGEGEYIFGPIDRNKELRAAVTWMNKMYEEEIMDRDFLIRDNDTSASIIAQNKTGLFITYGDNGVLWGEGGTDGVNFINLGILETDGTKPAIAAFNYISNQYYLPKTNNDAKLDKILEMFNFIYSDEGRDLFSWGFLNETYTITNGKYAFTDKIMKHELGPVNGRRQFGINPNPFPHISAREAWLAMGHSTDVKALEILTPYLGPSHPVLAPTDSEAAETTQISADLNKYIQDTLPKFIVGDLRIEDEWDNFTETLRSMGYDRLNEIVQAQYKRWMAR